LCATVVDIKAGVFPGEEIGEFGGANEFGVAEGLEEAVAKEFDGWSEIFAGRADAALVAGGAEVAALAGEGEEAFVATIGALESGEAGGEVATAEKGLDGGDGGGRERAEGFAVMFLGVGEEVIPAVVDKLLERRGAGTTGLVDGRHKECSCEHRLCGSRSGVMDRI
jgi:hypothetical protein